MLCFVVKRGAPSVFIWGNCKELGTSLFSLRTIRAFFLPVTLLFAIYTLIRLQLCWTPLVGPTVGLGCLTQGSLPPPIPTLSGTWGQVTARRAACSFIFPSSLFSSATSLLLKTLKTTSANWEVGVVGPPCLLEHKGI